MKSNWNAIREREIRLPGEPMFNEDITWRKFLNMEFRAKILFNQKYVTENTFIWRTIDILYKNSVEITRSKAFFNY